MPGPVDVAGIVPVLQNKLSPFDDVMKALDKLQILAEHPESLVLKAADVTDLRTSFITLANDNRSKIVVKTCKIIQLFSENLKNAFDRIASNIFPTYLEKVSSGITVISSSIAQTCLSMTKNVVMKSNIAIITSSIENRSEKVADISIQCLENVLKYWPSNIVDSFQTVISLAVVKSVSSYSERVRLKARSIVLLCDKDYPSLASIIHSKLPVTKKKMTERGQMRSVLPSVSPKKSPTQIATMKPRASAAVTKSLSSFKQNDKLFVLNQHVMFKDNNIIRYGTIKYIGYPDKANSNLFVGLLLDQKIDSKFDGTFLDRKLFDCPPGFGLLTVSSSIFSVDDVPAKTAVRRTAGTPNLPSPFPRRSAMVSKSASSQSSQSVRRTQSIQSMQSIQSIQSIPSIQSSQSPVLSQVEPFSSIDECIAQHKLMLFNTIKGLQQELRMVQQLEEVKTDREAIKAYKRDMTEIVQLRCQECNSFIAKLTHFEPSIVC